MVEPLFNVALIKTCTRALGPGKRMVIWFQGCDIGCRGCCNPDLQPMVPRMIMRLSEIVGIARRSVSDNGIEGITMIGGEPTLQSSLPSLARGLRGLGLGIILFTGRRFEELDDDLVDCIDLIIDGRYEDDSPDGERRLVGSTNQRIIDVSGRYSGEDWFFQTGPDVVEIDLDGDVIVSNGSNYRCS